jgi:hypothetical protein
MIHEHAVLHGIGCVLAAVLLYLTFALLWGTDDDGETLGLLERAPLVPMEDVSRV